MKTKNAILGGLTILSLCSPYAAHASVPEGAVGARSTTLDAAAPFSEGTGTRRLSDDEKQSLLEYANNSASVLSDALDAAKGKGFAEANRLYLFAIKKVVVASYQSKPRAELLMRQALNQALELTFGVPASDGKETEGVLAGSTNQELLTVILQDSIQLAIQYADDDRKAITNGDLVNLPYIPFASQRLALAQKWLASVTEWNYMYSFSVTMLQQWLNTALGVDNLTRAQFAEEIVKVDQALGQLSEAGPVRDGVELQRRVRYLRGTIRKILASLAAKINTLKTYDTVSRNDGSGFVGFGDGTASFNVGDAVYDTSGYSGKVVGVFPDLTYSVYISAFGSAYRKNRDELAKTSGCAYGGCVDEYRYDRDGYSVKIVGIFSRQRFAVYYSNFGSVYAKSIDVVDGKTEGCIRNGYCVGKKVIDKDGYTGKIVAVYSDGVLGVYYDNFGSVYRKDPSILALTN